METNEILHNEAGLETSAEELTKVSSGKGLKVAAGIGLAVLAGVVIYKYVGKPMIAKIKVQKEETQAVDIEQEDFNESDVVNVEEKENSKEDEK